GVGFNLDKIELLYKDVEVTSTSSSGRTSTYQTSIPRIRINGGEPKDYNGPEMLRLFKDCPQAKKEVKLYMENKQKANNYFLGGFLIGGGIGLAGLLGAAALDQGGKKGSGIVFGAGVGLGLTTFIVGWSKSRKYRNKINGNLRSSVEKYNLLCYKPQLDTVMGVKTDSIVKGKLLKEDAKEPFDGITEHYKEEVGYELLRNDPEALRFWSLGISPFGFEAANNRGFSMFLIADMTVQLGSKVGFSADFKKALVDNLSRSSNKNNYKNSIGEQFPAADYAKAMRTGMLVSVEVMGKTSTKKHEVFLGDEVMEGRAVKNIGTFDAKQRMSYVVRGGFSYENAIYYSENSLPVGSSNTSVIYEDETSGNLPVPTDYMSYAMPMVKSSCLAIGFGRKKIFDYKIELLNNARFKGKRNTFGYSELYCDFMYGLMIKSGEVAYRYEKKAGSLDYSLTSPLNTDLTEFNKLGFRAGYNAVSNGMSFGIETGVRPGISTERGYLALNFIYRFGNRF
ncbi:MAG: hypothetical protein KBF35_01935, partial [Saprospiraceae bacterium]|nr:hypothetical protein [Saprospiraceae bacterium]